MPVYELRGSGEFPAAVAMLKARPIGCMAGEAVELNASDLACVATRWLIPQRVRVANKAARLFVRVLVGVSCRKCRENHGGAAVGDVRCGIEFRIGYPLRIAVSC